MSESRRSVFALAPLLCVAALAAGCKRIEPFDPFDPNAEAEVPDWVAAEFQDRKSECEDAVYYDETEYATFFSAGRFFEDGGSFLGNEFWLYSPNPKFEEVGFVECMVVFDVAGTKIDSTLSGASYAVSLQASVDEEQTTCPEGWDGTPIYFGYESWTETYNVVETPNDGVSLVFDSGNAWATGTRFGNGFEWMQTDVNCQAY